jgi:hypothetical protein
MSVLPIGTQNYSNEELALMSSAQYRSINSGPWEESYMDNLELSRTSGLGSLGSEFTDFDTDRTMDVSTGRINNGRMSNLSNRLTDSALETEIIIFNTNSTDATKGIIEETNVTRILFSRQNMDALQARIRYGVFTSINEQISNQDENELYVIMRSIALQYGNFVVQDPIPEVKRLNDKIVLTCVDKIVTNYRQYIKYLDDIQNLPVPLDNPHYANKNNFTYNSDNLPR